MKLGSQYVSLTSMSQSLFTNYILAAVSGVLLCGFRGKLTTRIKIIALVFFNLTFFAAPFCRRKMRNRHY